MKYIKRFNESAIYHGEHEILDYFQDLEDRGIIQSEGIADIDDNRFKRVEGYKDLWNKEFVIIWDKYLDLVEPLKLVTPLKILHLVCDPKAMRSRSQGIETDLENILTKCNDSNGNVYIIGYMLQPTNFINKVLKDIEVKCMRISIFFIEKPNI